jgi:predicted PurR-regulated permease PerM
MIGSMVAAAVVVALVVYATVRFVNKPRGPHSSRLAAILVIYIVAWMLIAAANVRMAGEIASYGAGGVSELITGTVHFLNDVFVSH